MGLVWVQMDDRLRYHVDVNILFVDTLSPKCLWNASALLFLSHFFYSNSLPPFQEPSSYTVKQFYHKTFITGERRKNTP